MAKAKLVTEVREGILATADMHFSVTHEMLLGVGADKVMAVIGPSLLGQLQEYERELRNKSLEDGDPHSACPRNAPCGLEASDGEFHGMCVATRL